MLADNKHSRTIAFHPDVNRNNIAHTLAILRPLGKRSAGKQYHWDGTSWRLLSGYDRAKYFRCHLRNLSDLGAWHTLLLKITKHNVFLVMGLPTENSTLKRMTRRVRSRPFINHNGEHLVEPPTLADRPGYLLPFDFDAIPCPADHNVIQEPDQAIRWLIKTTLPVEFHNAGVVYQFSSSFGLTSDKLKVHLFFWMVAPVTMAAVKQWARLYNDSRGYVRGDNNTKTVDDAVYQPQQPIYTMNRVCHGAVDPVPALIGLLPGPAVDFEAVRMQQKQQDEVNRAERKKLGNVDYSGNNGQGVVYRLSRIGVDGHHAPIRNAAAAIVATEGRAAVEADLGGYVALLGKHVEQADRLGKPEAGFRQTYLADNYLRQQFHSALNAGFGDSQLSGIRSERPKNDVSHFKHRDWLVKSGFPSKGFDLSGNL